MGGALPNTGSALVAFDVMRADGEDLLERLFRERRARLERVFADAVAPLRLTPITDDPDVAQTWLEGFAGGGIDGVVAKSASLPYRPGERVMVKVKVQHTAECVVAGYRWLEARPAIGSLLLALYGPDGRLWHVGVASAFTKEAR